jgi:UDP-N-acetylmuramoylalanine--D-glutamate ligase
MNTDIKNKNLAAMTAQLLQKRRKALKKPFQSFTNVPHRMEQVRTKNGVMYINDSKAENVNATYFALQSIKKPVIWIAGGADAETDYWELMALVRQKVEAIIIIGANPDRLYHLFSPVINHIYEAPDMDTAVRMAQQMSEPGTSVLLSPACKPDYRFADYQDRGEQFVKAVNKF